MAGEDSLLQFEVPEECAGMAGVDVFVCINADDKQFPGIEPRTALQAKVRIEGGAEVAVSVLRPQPSAVLSAHGLGSRGISGAVCGDYPNVAPRLVFHYQGTPATEWAGV